MLTYSRTSLFRSRLIRNPGFFESQADSPSFDCHLVLTCLFWNPTISTFFSCSIGIRNSGVQPYLVTGSHFLNLRVWGWLVAGLISGEEGNIHIVNNRAVYTRENKPRITQSAAYVSHKLGHLYDHGLHKKLVHGLHKPRTSFLCRLYEQFTAYISRGLCNLRLLFSRINVKCKM